MLRLHLWEVRDFFIPLIHWPDKWVNICVSATHIEFLLCPSHDINTCLWNCPLTCRKPCCLSHVCLQMTTVRVRVTLMTGSKVSDHSIPLQGVRCCTSASMALFLRAVFLRLVQQLPNFGFNNWPCLRPHTCNWNICHMHKLSVDHATFITCLDSTTGMNTYEI